MNSISKFIENSHFSKIAITGNAGAGKTTLLNSLSDIATRYSIDWRFIGDSEYRKEMLKAKANSSISSYIDACNQYNWWNWDTISSDLKKLDKNEPVNFSGYDRDTSLIKNVQIIRDKKKIIVEGAILGPESLVNHFDIIFFIYTPESTRFERILSKDLGRRSLNEVLARFLITEYSESIYYQQLFENNHDKILIINNSGDFINLPNTSFTGNYHLPIPI
jgi:uridine kinase